MASTYKPSPEVREKARKKMAARRAEARAAGLLTDNQLRYRAYQALAKQHPEEFDELLTELRRTNVRSS